MAAIRRSKTAPQALEYQVRPGLTRAKSTVDCFIHRLEQTSVPASSQYRFSASVAAAASPLASPRDMEDPFSLTGFFAAPYLSSQGREGEHWEWLRQEQAADVETADVDCPPGPVVFAREAEEETEDKMGVLSVLNSIFSTQDSEDDHDSLYIGLCRHGSPGQEGSGLPWWWPVRWALHAMSSIV